MAATLLVDLTTGEAWEYSAHAPADLECEARNRGRQTLRPDRPRGFQGPLRYMTFPANGFPVLDHVNMRRMEHGLAPFGSLVRQRACA